MRLSNLSLILSAALFTFALPACLQQKDEGASPNVQMSEGKLEGQELAPGCIAGTLTVAPGGQPVDPKLEAMNICAVQGLELTNLQQEYSCNGPSGDTTYECCPAPPPPPPPLSCSSGEIGDGVTCQDIGVFKMPAWEACKLSGTMMLDLVYETAGCPDGEANKAVYECGVYGDACP